MEHLKKNIIKISFPYMSVSVILHVLLHIIFYFIFTLSLRFRWKGKMNIYLAYMFVIGRVSRRYSDKRIHESHTEYSVKKFTYPRNGIKIRKL